MEDSLITNKELIVRGEHYRFTILTERLLRLEYSPDGIFNDNETLLVKNRNFEKCDFEVQQDNKYLVIKTKYFSLSYSKEKPFEGSKLVPTVNLKVDLNGTDRTWYYNHPEVKNLGGNFISLDGNETDDKPRNGLYSLDGFASFDDSKYYYDENNNLMQSDDKRKDIYLFMYNSDFTLALKDYFKLTGNPAMIPRYALGNWWSRDLDYTSQDILDLVNHFEKCDIPLSVLLLDEGWHSNFNQDKSKNITGFTFNKELISDPATLIKELHSRGIHVGLQIDPINGINPEEENYKAATDFFQTPLDKIIAFDPFNPIILDGINKIMLSPLTKLGVDFFWNDIKSNEIDNLGLYLMNKSLYSSDDLYDKDRLILSRNGLIATHRYPITYTGKTLVGWETLRKIPNILEQASNIGVSWISTDVAGNYGGVEEEELYVRSIELSTFSPILRFHAPRGRYYRKEPWRWNAKTLEVIDNYLNLRHQLIPYLYSINYNYHKYGDLVIRPLYYDYPWVYDDTDYKNEYYFGNMLVSPILTKKNELINRTIHRFFIPDGIWYDFKTGKKFPGNKEHVSFFRDEDYPVFVKRGTVIPINKNVSNNFVGNPDQLEIHVFPGESNSFNLYEDNGDKHLITQLDYNYLPSNYTLIIRTLEGDKGVVNDYRDYKIVFRNTKKTDDVIAYHNSTQIKTVTYVDDSDFIVEINHVPSMGQVTINCKGKDIEIDAMRFINDDIDSILLDLPINTVLKEKISSIMFSELPLKRKRIEIRKLKKFNLGREYINLFLDLLGYISQI